MIYNAVILVYILLAAFPCIGEEERTTIQLLFDLVLTFNVDLGRIVLTRKQYEQAQELLPQLLVLSARHHLIFPTGHTPSYMNLFVILQTIVHPLMDRLSLLDRLEVGATEQEARQLFNLSLDRLQAAVDAWVCENSEIAFPKSETPTPINEHTHNLMARGHGDVWWNSPCQSKPGPCPQDSIQPAPLTEANLQKHLMLQRPQLLSNFLSVPPSHINPESPTSSKFPFATSSAAEGLSVGCSAGSRPTDMPRWVKYLGVHSYREGFSNSTQSFGPLTPRDVGSPRASWGYQDSSDRRCSRVLPWDDATSDDQIIDDDDDGSVDVYERAHVQVRKAKKATLGRKLVRRLKAVWSSMHF